MNSFIKHIVSVALPLILLSACASNPAPLKFQSGQSINLKPPSVQHIDLQLQSKSGAVASGVALGAAGAVGGAAVGGVGGAIFGLGCGPLFIVCSPLFAAVGAGGVGAMGGAAGVGYGGKGWTSGDKGAQFNAHTESGFDQATLEAGLHARISNALGEHWMPDPSSSNVVMIDVTSLRFEQMPRQRIRLNLDAEMTAVIDGRTQTFHIRLRGPERHIDHWLQDDGAALRQELNAEFELLAETVMENLSAGTSTARYLNTCPPGSIECRA